MVIRQGQIWWADMSEEPIGSAPGFRRPVIIVQSETFNRTRLPTVVCVLVTSNLRLLDGLGNVLLESGESGLPKDSVANVTQILTLDRSQLLERVSPLPSTVVDEVLAGVQVVLGLPPRVAWLRS